MLQIENCIWGSDREHYNSIICLLRLGEGIGRQCMEFVEEGQKIRKEGRFITGINI